MPPPETHKTLAPREIALLERWIKEGAPYEPHWAFIAPERPALPAVRQAGSVANPIDRFVLARLEEEGLTPNPEADRHTLIRRVTLDLTGPAAHARGARRVRPRHVPEGLRRAGRPAACASELRRAPRALLARLRALRRHPRLSLRQLPQHLALPRLGDRRLQRQPALRPVHAGADRRRPAAEGHARPADRDGLHPRRHEHQRRRHHPRGEPGDLRDRPRRDHVAGLAGADRWAARGATTTSSIPSAPRTSTAWRRSSGTPRSRPWTATSWTRRRSCACPRPRTPQRNAALPGEIDDAIEGLRLPSRGRRARVPELAADPGGRKTFRRSRTNGSTSASSPTPPSPPPCATWSLRDRPSPSPAEAAGRDVAPGPGASPGRRASPPIWASSATSTPTSRSPCGAWVQVTDNVDGALLARMDVANGYRGWDLCDEGQPRRTPDHQRMEPGRAAGPGARSACRRKGGTTSSSPTTARGRPRASGSTTTASRRASMRKWIRCAGPSARRPRCG